MQRHELSVTSLIAGLVFVALAATYMVGAYTDLRLDPRLWFPLTLVALGLAGLVGSLVASRRNARKVAAAREQTLSGEGPVLP
ncbi:MAG: hypothetical protein WCP28_00715 [Actinomycetes bacterium]